MGDDNDNDNDDHLAAAKKERKRQRKEAKKTNTKTKKKKRTHDGLDDTHDNDYTHDSHDSNTKASKRAKTDDITYNKVEAVAVNVAVDDPPGGNPTTDGDASNTAGSSPIKKDKKSTRKKGSSTSKSDKSTSDKKKKKKHKHKTKTSTTKNSNQSEDRDQEQEQDQQEQEQEQCETKALTSPQEDDHNHNHNKRSSVDGGIVASSAIEFYDEQVKQEKKSESNNHNHEATTTTTTTTTNNNNTKIQKRAQDQFNITLLLFYQYIEPVWDEATYAFLLKKLPEIGTNLELTGRMRVAKEGLNCTLTGSHDQIVAYCNTLRQLRPKEFATTEFKLTTDLPRAQRFPNLKVLKVVELVHYGLEGSKAPPIAKFKGTHLEPKEYHQKLGESNTVIIDVRNHYEAAIGRFVPPSEAVDHHHHSTTTSTTTRTNTKQGKHTNKHRKEDATPLVLQPPPPQWLDPKMRKSTEFPAWLDKPETKELIKGKQVLMYCTGGIRCERASALLKYKMETDPSIKDLDIQGVFQLQGGIDKYFKEFPEGGYWQGKNYVFDKRFAHAPPKVAGERHGKAEAGTEDTTTATATSQLLLGPPIMGRCEACQKPWDMYRGKRRCPTCGVPSLICRNCFMADKQGQKKLGRNVRCDLCVEQGITSKRELREKDQSAINEYERKMAERGLLQHEEGGDNDDNARAPNPDQVTRLHLKNMCRKNMDEATLMEALPGITHIVWRIERKSGNFLGQGWVEFATPDDAARAVAKDGKINLLGRPLHISFQPPDGKDAWPPSSSTVTHLR